METYIDIRKSLPGFKLDIKISTLQGVAGILGPSGSGKSILLKCIAGFVNPDEGKIIIHGRTVFDSNCKINLPSRERKVGILFQNYALFNHLNVYDNIGFGLDHLTKDEKRAKIKALIARFHLAHIETSYPLQISGGQQQRVALARTMAVEPDILLLDEPFSALDTHLKAHMMKEMVSHLQDFKGESLLVTHNVDEAYQICQHIFILKDGKVVEDGNKKLIFQNPKTLDTAEITGYKNIAQWLKHSENMIQIPNWHINVRTSFEVKDQKGYVAINGNHIRQATEGQTENVFPVWVAGESELPFLTTLYLKIGSPPENQDDFHLQWEIPKDRWQQTKICNKMLKIYLPPENILFINK